MGIKNVLLHQYAEGKAAAAHNNGGKDFFQWHVVSPFSCASRRILSISCAIISRPSDVRMSRIRIFHAAFASFAAAPAAPESEAADGNPLADML